MLQAGYDSRKGDFDQVITACDCPADLSTDLSYITVEPSLRFALLNLILFIWWSTFGFQLDKSFTYQLGINPAYPDQEATPVKVILIKSKNNYFNANWSRI
jgi:hypothetical protein